MNNMTIQNIAAACGGRIASGVPVPETEVSAITTDSREITPGCLFAAIAGERADGHDFILSTLASGAICALAERMPEGCGGPVILVASVQEALQRIAAFYRSQFDIPFIGVTGSVGKTTCKEMVAAVLGEKFCVHKTQGNFNNELGVPLTVFGLREEHRAAVIEMGISHFGEMHRLAQIVRPDIAVFTLIGYAHLEFLGDRAGVLRAKSELLESMEADGTVLVNGDDDLLRELVCKQQKISFGLGETCDLRALHVRPGERENTLCTIAGLGRTFPVDIPAYGDHMVYAALAAAAVGIRLGLTDAQIAQGIARYEPVGHRARILRHGGMTIIDDCYNSNPSSLGAAIRSMSKLEGRKVCILGDMLELGENAAALHGDMGALAVHCGAQLVLTAGPMAEHTARAAGSAGVHFSTAEALLEHVREYVRPGDVILIKASHSMGFERITALLTNETEKNCG